MLLTASLTQILIYTLVSYPIIGGLSFIVSSLYYWLLMEKADQPRYLKKGDAIYYDFSASPQ